MTDHGLEAAAYHHFYVTDPLINHIGSVHAGILVLCNVH